MTVLLPVTMSLLPLAHLLGGKPPRPDFRTTTIIIDPNHR